MDSSNGHTSFGWPAKSYNHQVCAGTGCHLEDLPRAMANNGSWRGRAKRIHADSIPGRGWHFYIRFCPTPPHKQNVTWDQFLNWVKQVWIQSFPPSRLVVFPIIYSLLERKYLDSCLSQVYYYYVKCKQLFPGFELRSPSL